MRIVQINYTYGSGDSTGQMTMEIHRWLQKQGHSSYVHTVKVNDVATELSQKEISKFSSEKDGITHAFLSHLTGLQGYYSKKSTLKLIKKLKSQNPQIVILHVLHSNCINFPILFRYLSVNDIAVILVLHDCWYFTGHCCHYKEVGCRKWKDGCGKCPQIHQWNSSWFFNTSKRALADKYEWFSKIEKLGVIGVSDWITTEARQSVLKSAAIIRRIYNWIDMVTFRPQKTDDLRERLNIQEGTYVLLGVAVNWSDRKGLQEILFTSKEFSDAKIVLVGGVPQNVQWPENIIRIGTIKEPALLSKYYAMADVFLNPSVQETFGKTTAEAFCCGTPVVAYETTACVELINRRCGKIVPFGNRKEYLKAVKEVLADGKEKYSLNCLEFARKNFSLDINIQAYISLMQELIKSNGDNFK